MGFAEFDSYISIPEADESMQAETPEAVSTQNASASISALPPCDVKKLLDGQTSIRALPPRDVKKFEVVPTVDYGDGDDGGGHTKPMDSGTEEFRKMVPDTYLRGLLCGSRT